MVVPWCDAIEQASGGDLKCQIFPSMQLGGSPTQLYDQVKDGVADVVFAVPGFSAGRFPSVEVFELPFMMKDAGATSKALWDYVAQNEVTDFAEVKPLFLNVHGPGLFHMVSKPIMSRADLQGMKVRAPTRQSSNLIAKLGGIPVGMPLPQVPEALSKGVIDGVVVPYEIVPAIKVNELTRFHSEPDPSQAAIYTTVFLFAMNIARYDSLSPEQKEVIDAHSGVELSGRIGKIMSDADALGRDSIPADSINVISGDEVKKWVALSQPVIDRWVEDMNNRGANGSALLESARRLTENYSTP
jgi:TRAP-type C4-dicarboxylate transport system substrate-binding protein